MGRRRRKGQPIHGWLIIDKPSGPTSAKVVAKVRALTQAAKIGHGGTLDPLATGVLPLALGEATKTVSHVMDGEKSYRFTLRWGEQTETDDSEGDVVATSDHRPDAAAIAAALPQFIGTIDQVPPNYSAIKVDGQRAYDLARADAPVALAPRPVVIHDFRLVRIIDRDHAEFAVDCGKGTYMRALARDLAVSLGTVGHIVALRRTRVGRFDESRAISLDMLESLGHSAALEEYLLPVETALDDIPALALNAEEAVRLRNGQDISFLQAAKRSSLEPVQQGTMVRAMFEGRLLAMARVAGGKVQPVRVMNY